MTWEAMNTAPRKDETAFLVRPVATDPRTGEKYLPNVVYKTNGKLYCVATNSVVNYGEAKLEWHDIPQ